MTAMLPRGETIERLRTVWMGVAGRFAAYTLALPGCPAFVCQPEVCDAHCCRAFSVSLGDREVARMHQTSGLQPIAFLESEDGAPLTLPMAQPYLLRRADNHCAQLAGDLSCGTYAGRPNACRLYPHFIIFIDTATGRPVAGNLPVMREAAASLLDGEAAGRHVPRLVRHNECPGFTGPPMDAAAWLGLFAETYRLQFEDFP